MYLKLHLRSTNFVYLEGGGAGSGFRGIICPPGLIWTDLPNSGGGASLLQCPKKALLIDHKLSFIFIL